MSKAKVLKYDVFVAPELPFNGPPARVANSDPPAWDPKTATLIFGERDAVLVDALTTVREVTALANWIGLHDHRLTTIYITHGHGDHFLALTVQLERFPCARVVATSGTVDLMRKNSTPDILDHGFGAWFPGQLSDAIVLAEPLDSMQFEIEGWPLVVVETGHTGYAQHHFAARAGHRPDCFGGCCIQPLPHVHGRNDPGKPSRMGCCA